MNILKRKLRSNAGASLLLAMVFMLFCVMIGGTVLSAASANGYRLKRMSDSQQYLDQRSAAMLIAQELKIQEDSQLRLTITDVSRTVQPVKIERNGQVKDSGSPVTTHVVTVQFPADVKVSAMQRVVLEASIWQYLESAELTQTNFVTLVNFVYDDGDEVVTVSSMDDFWYQYELGSDADFTGTIDLSGTLTDEGIVSQQVSFAGGTEDDMYDFTFDFGESSHICVSMDASFTKKSPMNSSYVVNYEDSPTNYARITTESNQTAIIWTNPVIEKGGN